MIIKITVLHNYLKNRFLDIRFDDQLLVKEVKAKIYTMTGTVQKHQKLILKRAENDLIVVDDKMRLSDYNAQDGMEMYVYDQNQNSIVREISERDWRDMPDVWASDDMYEKCKNNVINQISEKMKDDAYKRQIEQQHLLRHQINEKEEQQAKDIKLGQIVYFDNKQAVVKYVGEVDQLGCGIFYGLEVEQLKDGNDGKFMEKQYFKCKQESGIFVKYDQFQLNYVYDGEQDEL